MKRRIGESAGRHGRFMLRPQRPAIVKEGRFVTVLSGVRPYSSP